MLAKSHPGIAEFALAISWLLVQLATQRVYGQDASEVDLSDSSYGSTTLTPELGSLQSSSAAQFGSGQVDSGVSTDSVDKELEDWKRQFDREYNLWKARLRQRTNGQNMPLPSSSRSNGGRFNSVVQEALDPLAEPEGGDDTEVPGGAVESSLSDSVPTPANSYRQGYDPAIPDYFDLDLDSSNAIPQRLVFGPGFQIQSADERFRLQIHYESQIEARVWTPDDLIPANSGFFLPRQRFFFAGNITKTTEYELAINRGLGNINLLNAFLNFRFGDQVMLRIGRFFTPLFYDQYAVSNYWLLTPERSLFTTNLSTNRQIGAMLWGYLFDKRLDYAAGIFNGSRNSFESLNNGQDFVGYLNARPFQNSQYAFAQNWNVGTSLAYGSQDQAPVPSSFRIGGGSPDANIPGVATLPFLILNPGVRERGERLVGSVHMAYFFRSLTVMSEWQYGYGNYALSADSPSDQIDFGGFYFQLGYFLTGEQIERRTRLKPLRPFAPVDEDQPRGMGAWEVVSRVSQLSLGKEVFTSGLADPDVWSNVATTTEVGVNWYLNEYMKLYFCWLHASFSDPVEYQANRTQKHADLFWTRCQLYF